MDLREAAVALRLAGKSRREIKAALGVGHGTLDAWLGGVPAPEWTKRPRAKDDLRERARELRRGGKSYREIVEELGVAKSSVSLWVRDLPQPMPNRAAHAQMMRERRWEPYRRRRDSEIASVKADAVAKVGDLSDREVLLVGAALYWAEGAKRKPWSQARVPIIFTNSDRGVIEVFERWLDLIGAAKADRRYRISIHESADIAAAHRFWGSVLGIAVEEFQRPTIKRHNPRTVRHNTGSRYNGCLVIQVRKSSELYDRVEGWWEACVRGVRPKDASQEIL